MARRRTSFVSRRDPHMGSRLVVIPAASQSAVNMSWAYVAGFTDGDGCISIESIRKERRTNGSVYMNHSVRVRWSQKRGADEMLYVIAEFLRAHGIKCTSRNFSIAIKGHKYPQTEMGITNSEHTRLALTAMLPHLVVKQRTAVRALETLDLIADAKACYGWKYRVCLEKLREKNTLPERFTKLLEAA